MEKETKRFRIITQYIKDLSFENKLAIDHKASKVKPEPNFNLDIKTASLGNSIYEVSLVCNVDAKIENETVYIIELIYCGICSVSTDSEIELKNFLYSKVPAFIYPYARRIISSLTMDSNFPTINIGPIYFEEIKSEDIDIDQ